MNPASDDHLSGAESHPPRTWLGGAVVLDHHISAWNAGVKNIVLWVISLLASGSTEARVACTRPVFARPVVTHHVPARVSRYLANTAGESFCTTALSALALAFVQTGQDCAGVNLTMRAEESRSAYALATIA